MGAEAIRWRLSGASSSGASQPDPALSIGNYRAAENLFEFQSQASAASTSTTRRILVDSSRIGDGDNVHRGKLVTIIVGPAYPLVTRVLNFESSTGTFLLLDPMPGDVAIGDYYRLWGINNLFGHVTAQQCIDGLDEWRVINMSNTIANMTMQYWIQSLAPGKGHIEIMASRGNAVRTSILPGGGAVNPFDEFGQVITNTYNEWNEHERMRWPAGFTDKVSSDRVVFNHVSTAIMVHRVIPPGTEKRDLAGSVIVLVTDETGNDPDPIGAFCPISWSCEGFDPDVDLTIDQRLRVNGGCRVEADVKVAGTNTPIVDRDLRFGIGSTDPGSMVGDVDQITDEVGRAGTTYQSPTDEGEVGNTVTFQVRIGGGDELI